MNVLSLFILIHLMQASHVLFEFSTETNPDSWQIVNDGVMGGRSKGKLSLSGEGTGIFEGFVSLENNGGFTMIQYRFPKKDVSAYTSIELRLRGDGKTYQVRLKSTSDQYFNYSCSVKTTGDWQTVRLPFENFLPQFRGRPLDKDPFPGEELGEVAILIGNKKAEEFRLELHSISLR